MHRNMSKNQYNVKIQEYGWKYQSTAVTAKSTFILKMINGQQAACKSHNELIIQWVIWPRNICKTPPHRCFVFIFHSKQFREIKSNKYEQRNKRFSYQLPHFCSHTISFGEATDAIRFSFTPLDSVRKLVRFMASACLSWRVQLMYIYGCSGLNSRAINSPCRIW